MIHEEFREAGHKIFGLHGVTKDGFCECGNPTCQALHKHPKITRWQNVPVWSDEQYEFMTESGQFDNGYGVLLNGLLVVDVDERNNGHIAYDKLLDIVPEIAGSGLIVKTGSGGQSKHLYFSVDPSIPLVTHHKAFDGIDFKSGSGFCVGAGSKHISGNRYELLFGSPYDIEPAPKALIELLKKPERHRATVDGQSVDVSDNDIVEMLQCITPDCDYEQWYRVGMAIHEATQGGGYLLWDEWSANGKKYEGANETDKKWQSFGKSGNPVGLGTLIHYAREGGYVDSSVEFTPTVQFETDGQDDVIDLLRPPGFIGELTQWVNDQCLYPRESLAVAAALVAVSNLGGMRYRDELDGMTPNMMAFCVAGSGTGKEAIGKAFSEIMKSAGLSPALYGAFKSEQELYRNLLRHQPAYYSVDELGIQLSKIKNAMSRGGASYLEGLLGAVMSVYSKADSFLPITGDLKEEIRAQLAKEYGAVTKQLDSGKNTDLGERKLKTIERQLSTIDQGIEAPYLSLIGYTTPATFDQLFDFEQATNGFLSRAMIFKELETNPRRKAGFRKRAMPEQMESTLNNLYAMGRFDVRADERLEFRGDKTTIPTEPEAAKLLDVAYQDFWDMAEQHKGDTGLEAIPRRGYEMASKVSLILALPEGLRTVEHVRWAVALAKRDIIAKLALAHTNSATNDDERLASKIMSVVDKDHGETMGVIRNRCRSFEKKHVDAVTAKLVSGGHLMEFEEETSSKKQKTVKKYKALA